LKLVAATALAAAGIGAVTTSVGTSHWSNAVSNIAQKHSAASTASVGTAAHLDAYVPRPEIGIAGTLGAGAASASGNATAFGNVATSQHSTAALAAVKHHPAGATAPSAATAGSTVTAAHAPAAPAAPAPAAHAAAAPTAAKAAPAHAAPAHAAPAHAAPAHAAPAHAAPAPAHAAPAHTTAAPAHAAPAHRAAPAAPAKPYLIYDSVTPSSIPAGQAAATYANGAYAASASSVAGHGHVLWIDTNGSDPTGANALDVEPGDATPPGAAQWVWTKMRADHGATAIVYTMISDWSSVKANIGGLPAWMQPHVRYWIADPTGVPHVLPGASATQWYWGNNYDITTANPGFQG
jgi:translation initiation factor IF-2